MARLTTASRVERSPYTVAEMLMHMHLRLSAPLQMSAMHEHSLIAVLSLSEAKMQLVHTICQLCEEHALAEPRGRVDAVWMRWAYRLMDAQLHAFGV